MRIKESNYRLMPVYNVKQDIYRNSCGDGCEEALALQDSLYPPFQVIFDEDKGAVSNIYLIKICDGSATDSAAINATVIKVQKDIDQDGVDEWVYSFQSGSLFDSGSLFGILKGVYYLQFDLDGVTYYTETFCHPGGNNETCKPNWSLEWSHSCDEKSLGDYSANFKNVMNLGDILLRREGEIENTVSRRDGFGVETIVATDIRPRHSFEIIGNNWLFDSLFYLKLYDNIILRRSENIDEFQLRDINVEIIGDESDCFFPIKISFTKEILVNTKCCDSVYEQAPLPGNCDGMTAMLTDDFTVCAGQEVTLEAQVTGGAAPHIFIWSNGFLGPVLEVTINETTTFIVTIIDAFGCVKQADVTITAANCEGEHEVVIEASETSVCSGTEVDLDCTVTGGVGPFTFLWSTGETTEDISVTPSSTQTYSVEVTDTVSGDMVVALITIIVTPMPLITIINNGCLLSIQLITTCEEGIQEFEWQIETDPDTWEAASGTNNGTTYLGSSGNTYRLKVTCNGCEGFSNEITVTCTEPCSVEVTSITYDAIEEELTITWAGTLGSNGFISGSLIINETNTPNLGNCAASGGWMFVSSTPITAITDSLTVPYEPITLPTCMSARVIINAGECTDILYQSIDE